MLSNYNIRLYYFQGEKTAEEYCKNLLENETVENILMVTLNNDGSVICDRFLAEGNVSGASCKPSKIVAQAVMDNAAGVLLAHNHPHGSSVPSGKDIDFTLNIYNVLKSINVVFVDHIIVGENSTASLRRDCAAITGLS